MQQRSATQNDWLEAQSFLDPTAIETGAAEEETPEPNLDQAPNEPAPGDENTSDGSLSQESESTPECQEEQHDDYGECSGCEDDSLEVEPDDTSRNEDSGEGWVLRIPKPKLRVSKGGRRSRRLVAVAALTGSLVGAVVMIAVGPVMKSPVGSQPVAAQRTTEQPLLPSPEPREVPKESKRERQSKPQHRKATGGRKQQKPKRAAPKPKVSPAPTATAVAAPVVRPSPPPKPAPVPVSVPRSFPQDFSENDDNPIDDWQK